MKTGRTHTPFIGQSLSGHVRRSMSCALPVSGLGGGDQVPVPVSAWTSTVNSVSRS
jgi:hypothetical protein